MQAPCSLSPQQKCSLESTYACSREVASFLESIESKLQPEEKFTARNLRDLAAVCQHKLIEAFPELLEWLSEWERRVCHEQTSVASLWLPGKKRRPSCDSLPSNSVRRK